MQPSAQLIADIFATLNGACIGTVRTALSWIVLPKFINELYHRDIMHMIQGNDKCFPTLPRIQDDKVWDCEMILDYFRTQPKNKLLSVLDLGKKTVMLLLLATGRHNVDLTSLSLLHFKRFENHIKLTVSRLCKTYKKAYFLNQSITLDKHEEEIICPICALNTCIAKTRHLHTTQNIIIITCPPYTGTTSATISRWAKDVMKAAGVDMSMFTPYSTRLQPHPKLLKILNHLELQWRWANGKQQTHFTNTTCARWHISTGMTKQSPSTGTPCGKPCSCVYHRTWWH